MEQDSATINTTRSINLPPQTENGRSWKINVFRLQLCPWIPARYVLAIFGYLGFFNIYALRVNLSVAIVQMDNSTSDTPPGTKVRLPSERDASGLERKLSLRALPCLQTLIQ